MQWSRNSLNIAAGLLDFAEDSSRGVDTSILVDQDPNRASCSIILKEPLPL